MEVSALRVGFQFRVETQEFGVGNGFAVGGENGAECREDSRFPVNKRAIAVEGHEPELGEVQHALAKASPGPVPWAARLTVNDGAEGLLYLYRLFELKAE